MVRLAGIEPTTLGFGVHSSRDYDVVLKLVKNDC